jgi:Ca2+/Na+ antiporter
MRNWRVLLLGALFTVVFILFIVSVWKDPNLAQACVALGTLVLALVTALNIMNSNAQERRRREEEIAREQKDRRERLLNEIVEWAEGVLKSGYSENLDDTKLGEINDQKQEYAYIHNIFSRISTNYEVMKIKSIYIKNIAAIFGKELLVDVTTLTNYIIDYLKEIDYVLGTSDKEKESRDKLEYNNTEACGEIKRRMSSSKEQLLNQPEKMDLLAENIIEKATAFKVKGLP